MAKKMEGTTPPARLTGSQGVDVSFSAKFSQGEATNEEGAGQVYFGTL